MAEYVCLIQQGQTAESKQAELAAGLKRIGRDVFSDEDADIKWITVLTGFGFTAGRPSSSSLVARSVPVGFPDDQREAFMNQVCDLWAEVTGCSHDEIVVTALDGPVPL